MLKTIAPVGALKFVAATLLMLSGASLIGPPAIADGVSVVDPQTGHRVRLPDNDRDGRADYIPKRLDVHVSPALAYPRSDRQDRESHDSGGGSICHGNDGGSTVSTARRACNPSAPAGDGGARDAPGVSTGTPPTPTRPSSSSSTQLN